jgi:hypothetical protein
MLKKFLNKITHNRNTKKCNCGTCSSQRSRANNPVRYAYTALKNNSRRRGVFFDLTLEEFTNFCFETDYLAGKGRTKKSFSIDRIKEDVGYTATNICVLTVSDNSKKRWARLEYDYQTNSAHVVKQLQEVVDENDFF